MIDGTHQEGGGRIGDRNRRRLALFDVRRSVAGQIEYREWLYLPCGEVYALQFVGDAVDALYRT